VREEGFQGITSVQRKDDGPEAIILLRVQAPLCY